MRRAVRATLLAAPLFVAACAVPDGGLFRAARYRDVHLYGQYANAFWDGQLPYRDFFVEYPPGAFAVFMPPLLAGEGHYNAGFKTLMALLGLATIFLAALVLARLGAGAREFGAAVAFVAVSPVLLGPISLNTYDAWPAMLTVGALAALVHARERVALGLLGVGAVAKAYPVVLVPVALVYVAKRLGRERVLPALGVFAATVAAVVLPFAVLAPAGLRDSLEAQVDRALHVETLAASVLLAADRVGLYDATVVRGSTEAASRDVAGALPDALATATSVVAAAAVLLVALLFAGGRMDEHRLVIAMCAAVAGFLVFTKVLSPQYLGWLVPLVPLAGGVLAAAAAGLLACALVLGQLWFFHYRELFEVSWHAWLLLARNVLLVAIFAVLVAGLATAAHTRLKITTPSRSNTSRQAGSRRRRASRVAIGRGASRSA